MSSNRFYSNLELEEEGNYAGVLFITGYLKFELLLIYHEPYKVHYKFILPISANYIYHN